MSTCKSRAYCQGCRNDFYNGKNDLGVGECWSLKDATIVRKKFVSIYAMPPWKMKAEKTYSCHHRSGFVAVDPQVTA